MEYQSIGNQLEKEKKKKHKKRNRRIGLISLWFVLAFAMYGLLDYMADKLDHYVKEKKMDMGISQEEFITNFNKVAEEDNSTYTLTKKNGGGDHQLYCFEGMDCLMVRTNKNGNINAIYYGNDTVKNEETYKEAVKKMTYIMKAADPTISLEQANRVMTSKGISYQMVQEKQDKAVVKLINQQYFLTSKDTFSINIQNKH